MKHSWEMTGIRKNGSKRRQNVVWPISKFFFLFFQYQLNNTFVLAPTYET